jgi:tetratricopeptide (TPR) repeat protein
MAAQLTESSALLGRAHEMALLVDALDSAIAGQGRLVIVAGQAGIGKTRLADAIASEARQRDARVLWGRCWEAGGAPAFWPWVQAVRTYLRDVDPATAREALGPAVVDVARIVPDVRDVLPDVPEPRVESDEGQRFRIFAAMSSFLARVAARRPLVLILDDLHAADEPSVLLLRFLASEIADTRLLVIAIYRDDEVEAASQVSTILAELPRTPSAERLSPRGLGVEDVTRYLETVAGPAHRPGLAEAIQRETEGNPLFMTEVIRLLRDEDRLDLAPDPTGRGFGVTEGVRAVMRRRLARLSVPCRELLARASTLGGEVSIELLARLEGEPPEALIELLDEAAGARILVAPATPGGRWRFAHGLFREVLYAALPTATRVRLHQRVAEALEDLSRGTPTPPDAELAHHFVAAGNKPKAVEYARRAGERATELHAHEEAARLYRLALAVGDLDDRQRCELQIALGGALARAGNAAEARAEFLKAATIAEDLDLPEALAHAAIGYGGQFVWLRAGSDRTVVPLLERALEALGSRNDALRVRLLARLSGALRDEPELARRDAISAESVALARRLGDQVALGHALVARTWAIRAPDRTAEIDELTAELQALAPLTHDRELVLDGHWVRFNQMRVVGAEHAALRTELSALQDAKVELHQPHRLHDAVERSALGLLEGRIADVEGHLPGLAVAPDPFSVIAGTFLLRREQDRLEEVAPSVRAAVDDLPGYPLLLTMVAYLDARLGRPAAATEALERLAADGYSAIPWDWGWIFAVTYLAETALLLGNRRRAREIEALLEPFANLLGSASGEGSSGPVSRVLGLLAALDGRLNEALARLEKAARQSTWMGATLWETRVAVERAAILVQRNAPGDRDTALVLLSAALETARDLGLVAIEREAESVAAELAMTDSGVAASADDAEPEITPAAGGATAPAAKFHREGDTWAIDFGSPFRLRDSKGLRYLAVLLADPGREFHALDLAARVDGPSGGDGGGALSPGSALGDAGLTLQAGESGVDILDNEAKAAYRSRLRELSAELEEAEAFNDPARAERARQEIDALEAELGAAFGLGGRARSAISPAERARQSVSKAIRDSLRRIGDHDVALHGHLARSVRTGIFCSYDPDPTAVPRWSF